MSVIEFPNPVVFYMGKQMRYQVAISLIIAAEPDIGNRNESEQRALVGHDYAPDRIMSYRNQGGDCIPYGYVDIPNTQRSEAREKLDAMVDALPDIRYGIGGGGGGPIELLDPEVLVNFLAVVKDVAQEFMQPILIGVAIQQVSQYMNNRLDKKQMEQASEIRALTDKVGELEGKLSQNERKDDKEDQKITDEDIALASASNALEKSREQDL